MTEFPLSLLQAGEQRGIRTVALALLDDAVAEHQRLVNAPDDEALHDFRVAVRRLRSWLRAHGRVLGKGSPRGAVSRLRRVAAATNARRDTEVFVAWLEEIKAGQADGATIDSLLQQLNTREDDAVQGLHEDMTRDFTRANDRLREALPQFTVRQHLTDGVEEPSFSAIMATSIRQHAGTLQRRLHRIRGAEDKATIHRARIAGKRLRYLIEPIAPHLLEGVAIITRLKELQDTLGDLHDGHVWLEDLTRRRRADGETALDEGAGLQGILDRVRERLRQRYEAFTSSWDHDPRTQFFGMVDRMVVALDHHGTSETEIERKYLLSALPREWPERHLQVIEQGYLPGTRLMERLRHVQSADGDHWYRTVKAGTGLARLEVEEETPREVFEAMWPLTVGRRVTKRRHVVPDGLHLWEIDEFTDRDLVLAEVELSHVDEHVEIPVWLSPVMVREVTGEREYLNAWLAR